ncbi:hypothetical protein NYR70_03135 [Actinobacillus equuli subsp. equuli]|nr:hypothetical protein [Actinobacillus equuli]WGE55684.1 hypothetical protein NYR70_03135 [Actinobacillus equuli subsp. equuli]
MLSTPAGASAFSRAFAILEEINGTRESSRTFIIDDRFNRLLIKI